MSTSNDRQYRPVSTLETDATSPYTARYARDLADGVNNYKSKFGHKLISCIWPNDAPLHSRVGGSSPSYDFSGLYIIEQIITPFAPRYVPNGYTKMCIQAMHERIAGTGSTTWRLRAIHKLWGELPDSWGLAKIMSSNSWTATTLEAQGIPYTVEYGEWETDSDDPAASYVTFDCSMRDALDRVWFVLTAENEDADTFSRLWSLDVTPMVGT